jgi:DNA invertase Pin-like site-specific DNA recombinase
VADKNGYGSNLSEMPDKEDVRAAIYCRVSTDRQELSTQRDALKTFCERKGWEVVKIYEDITSGAKDSRPGFVAMFEDAHKQLFNMVVFWDLSRFSRSGLLFTIQKLQELENEGVGFHSYQNRFITTMDPRIRNLVIALMAEFAKIERQMISERTKARLQALKAKGVKLGRPGFPPEAKEKCKKLLSRWANPDDDEITAYKHIRKRVRYTDKNGKIHNISRGKISEIKKEMEQEGEL